MDRKALSFPLLISLVIGNMIGTGIYLLPASLAKFGSISLLGWVYTAFGAVCLAFTFTHLTKRFPKTGGPYIYCREAFGDLAGFIIAYTYWISYLVSIAGLAVSSTSYLGYIFPTFHTSSGFYNHSLALAVEIIFVWFFTLINLIGIHTAGVVQLFLTLIKIAPLIIISLLGFAYINTTNFSPWVTSGNSNFYALSGAATLTFWAFIGLETATVPAENTQGSRDIFKATLYGTLLTALIYIISTFVLMGMMGNQQLSQSQFPFADAATQLFGAKAAAIIAICAVISGLGALNACILIQGQILFAASRDKLAPAIFSDLSKHDVPIAAQLLSSSLITLFLALTAEPQLLKQFDNIALLAALLTLITYLVTTFAELKFQLKEKSLSKLIYSNFFWIAVIAVIYSVWMISSMESNILLVGISLVLLCIPIYLGKMKKKR